MDENKGKLNIKLIIWVVVCALLSLFIAIRTCLVGNYILGAIVGCYAIGGVIILILKIRESNKK
ncbi:hypothetical protein [Butyrivibrio sp. LB2008]|uniref:hypothetical protein n=1 Tax=Butyrivibrio sp. LB2008 TaxID=1408305 RepID=UPI000479699A|nr:hypothetical protein [Butyrivibrio sp. LB2008]